MTDREFMQELVLAYFRHETARVALSANANSLLCRGDMEKWAAHFAHKTMAWMQDSSIYNPPDTDGGLE